MATESVVETPAREAFDCASVASVGMKDDFYLEFGVPSRCCGAETMAEYAEQMAGWARAALKCARYRGDNDSDLPEVFDDALAASEVLFWLCSVLGQAAQLLPTGKWAWRRAAERRGGK